MPSPPVKLTEWMTAAVLRWAIKIYVVWGLFYCLHLFCFHIWVVWLNMISIAIQRKRLTLIAPSALLYSCFCTHMHMLVQMLTHTHTHTSTQKQAHMKHMSTEVWVELFLALGEMERWWKRWPTAANQSRFTTSHREKKKASSSINKQGISLIRTTGSISSCIRCCAVPGEG